MDYHIHASEIPIIGNVEITPPFVNPLFVKHSFRLSLDFSENIYHWLNTGLCLVVFL